MFLSEIARFRRAKMPMPQGDPLLGDVNLDTAARQFALS